MMKHRAKVILPRVMAMLTVLIQLTSRKKKSHRLTSQNITVLRAAELPSFHHLDQLLPTKLFNVSLPNPILFLEV